MEQLEPVLPARSGALPRVVWEVSGLVQAVSDALASRFAACSVRGELSGFTRAGSGHCYFTLKDAGGDAASLRGVMFRRSVAMLSFAPAEGQLVELRGRLCVYEPRGELQLVAEAMRPAGAGALYEEFLRRKARLETDGLFDAARKRPLPRFPRALGVVTSAAGAALHDVLTALQRRAPHVRVVLYPSVVQGSDAPPALVDALATANRRDDVDAVIVCRGGGSMEDLWAFNDERVVRAIASSRLPVVCGVGHETDVTLADLAADVRAPTPTAAAELSAPLRGESLDRLGALLEALRRPVWRVLDRNAQRLDRAASRLARPSASVQRQSGTLDLLAHRLQAALPRSVAGKAARAGALQVRLLRVADERCAAERRRSDAVATRLDAIDPRRVLARGFAWLADDAGHAITSSQGAVPGQAIHAIVADGRIDAVVTATGPAGR